MRKSRSILHFRRLVCGRCAMLFFTNLIFRSLSDSGIRSSVSNSIVVRTTNSELLLTDNAPLSMISLSYNTIIMIEADIKKRNSVRRIFLVLMILLSIFLKCCVLLLMLKRSSVYYRSSECNLVCIFKFVAYGYSPCYDA